MQATQSFEFTGTAKDFADQGVKLNGVMLDAVSVGALARHGLLEVVGDGPKPARGRTPKLYKAVNSNGMVYSFKTLISAVQNP